MADGWFIILMLLGTVVFVGALLWFWLTRVVVNHREKQELTATDLHLLQDTVEELIVRLKAASDDAVAEIDLRRRELQTLLDRVDAKLSLKQSEENFDTEDICRLAREGMDDVEIARRSGLNRGEVELMLELRAAGRQAE